MQVTVRDLMTSQPLTIREQATVEEATRKILENAVCEAYVVDESGRLLGMVSDYSLLKSRMIQADAQEPVTRFISRKMVLLTPQMRLDEVAGYFRESSCSRLAVVDEGRVVGQLSRRDVLRAIVVLEELAMASNDDEPVAAEILKAAGSEAVRIHRLESPTENATPTPAGLRTSQESGSVQKDRSLGTICSLN